MSSVKVQGNASGTGIFTVLSPNSNTDRTLTLPDQTGTVLTNAGPYTANASASNGAVTIDASNNVGIGTSSPGRILDVSKSGDAVIGIATTGTATQNNAGVRIGSPNKAYLIQTGETDVSSGLRIFDLTAGTERARIDSSGNLLVGLTSGVGRIYSQADGSSQPMLRTNDTVSAAATNNAWSILRNGTQVGTVTTTLSATAYNTSSDYRLKTDVAPMKGALATISALKPVTYKWKLDGSDGEGFIAHELAEVCPQAVSGEKDAVDAEGNPVYQGIDTSFLVATLTAAIQEQQAMIVALKAEVDALKAQLGAQA